MILHSPLSRKQIKLLKSLGKRSERQRQRLFIVEGLRAVRQIATNKSLKVESLILDVDLWAKDNVMEVMEGIISALGAPVFTISAPVFRQLTDTEATQGVMAICRMPGPVDQTTLLAGKGIILTTDHVQDPGNLGTMIRTSVWFGLSGIVLSPGTVDLFHPKVVRSTAGATGVLPWMESDLPSYFISAVNAGWRIHLLDAGSNSQSYKNVQPSGRDILVVGNEANGLISVTESDNQQHIRIDSAAETGVESLNVSVAAGIIMAHFAASHTIYHPK